MAATWEIIGTGNNADTDAPVDDVWVRVTFDCPDYPNPDSEDGTYSFDQEIMIPRRDPQRTDTLDQYAADYQTGYCASLVPQQQEEQP